MKIVHIVIAEKYIEGMSYQENLLSECHKRLGHDVYVIASGMHFNREGGKVIRQPEQHVDKNGICVTTLPLTTSFHYLHNFIPKTKGLYRRLTEIAPDVIFVHGVSACDNKYVARYVKENPHVQLFADNHNDYYNSPVRGAVRKFLSRFAARHASYLASSATAFWGTTPWRVDYLSDVYRLPAQKCGLLVMGADERNIVGKDREKVRDEVRAKFHIPSDAFLVVTGGVIDRRKQQALLMEAVSAMQTENVWLLVFGSPTKEMENVVARFAQQPNIVFAGWTAADVVYDYFLASDLAFFPGSHSVLWEQAVACGLPCVFKRWAGMTHVNVNGNAWLLNEVSTEVIKNTIHALLDSPQYFEMKDLANEIASQFFLTSITRKAIGLTC